MMIQVPNQGPPEGLVQLSIRPVRNGFIIVTGPSQKAPKVFIATTLEECLTMSAAATYTALEAMLAGSRHEQLFQDYTIENFMAEITALYTVKPGEDDQESALV